MNELNSFKKQLASKKYIDNDFAFLNLKEFECFHSTLNNNILYYHTFCFTEGEGSITIGSDTIKVDSKKIVILTPFIGMESPIQISAQLRGFSVSINIALICCNEYLQPMIDMNAHVFGVIKYIFEKEEDQGFFIYSIINKILELKLKPTLPMDFQLLFSSNLIKIFWLSICEMQHSQKNKFINRIPLEYELQLFYSMLKMMGAQLETTHNISDIEQKMGITSSMMRHLCLKYSNETPKMIFQRIIISKAKYSLLYTTQSIKEIAFSLGFSLPTNFNKFFNKHEAMTPLEFRNLYRLEWPIVHCS